jgi:hypothetical protein
LVAIVCLVSLLAHRPVAAQAANDYSGGNTLQPVTSVDGPPSAPAGLPQTTLLVTWRGWLANRLDDLDRWPILFHVAGRPDVTSVRRRGAPMPVRGSR